MQVKQVAENLGLSEHTIRYYDKAGLFPFVSRDKNGYRDFSKEDLYWIEFIKCMRQTHMPVSKLKEIAELYHQGSSTKMKRKDIFLEHQKNLIDQKGLINKGLQTLEEKFKLLDEE
ncbi:MULTISPECIES: MerR family transcriptional regulator [Staphylococcus]|jgi:DNA-binding transcriptional MerR regulator|uniref:MerR family transcriptional regulator n=1 Tax=Staphylococcus xylosus TaxID=1288 RepID=A0A418ILG2_STAXY|nr:MULTISPECIES: MerR family transcriptional regulator [Staphylococcus]MDW8544552.1 MerR family transcriptional regulator [Staphylococcus sp. KG4-1]MBF7023292.1 MerR family transcriptional regulator [Staphylococcus kloosii]MBF7025983.1 MerR family transcriptional regulator [Staphylococcus kloosii]MDW8544654.1 MerR family transcriptional regulator [Staphylococcus pseudoxylosus]MDW8563222.1 MerR family transcriptional regulator [Staphylococcus sp. KG4-3]